MVTIAGQNGHCGWSIEMEIVVGIELKLLASVLSMSVDPIFSGQMGAKKKIDFFCVLFFSTIITPLPTIVTNICTCGARDINIYPYGAVLFSIY